MKKFSDFELMNIKDKANELYDICDNNISYRSILLDKGLTMTTNMAIIMADNIEKEYSSNRTKAYLSFREVLELQQFWVLVKEEILMIQHNSINVKVCAMGYYIPVNLGSCLEDLMKSIEKEIENKIDIEYAKEYGNEDNLVINSIIILSKRLELSKIKLDANRSQLSNIDFDYIKENLLKQEIIKNYYEKLHS